MTENIDPRVYNLKPLAKLYLQQPDGTWSDLEGGVMDSIEPLTDPSIPIAPQGFASGGYVSTTANFTVTPEIWEMIMGRPLPRRQRWYMRVYDAIRRIYP